MSPSSSKLLDGNGAYIMGRKMFGGGPGDWDLDWTGWWGDDPPYHAPTSSSPTMSATRCRCRAAPPSTS